MMIASEHRPADRKRPAAAGQADYYADNAFTGLSRNKMNGRRNEHGENVEHDGTLK
jgi:hypothetical protein